MYISRYGFLAFQTPASILWSMISCMLLVHLGSDKLPTWAADGSSGNRDGGSDWWW